MCGMAHERIVWVCVCALYSVGKSLKAFLSEISGNFSAVSKNSTRRWNCAREEQSAVNSMLKHERESH